MKTFKSAYSKLNNASSGVSCHYLISRSGIIFNLLCPSFKAWHAGISQWKYDININDHSVGIELENKGHDHGYNAFTTSQYLSLKKLIQFFNKHFQIKDQDIIFHSDISPNRKKDPGEKFLIKKLGINRFVKNIPNKKKYSISALLRIYGFSSLYVRKYQSECIIAVKRSLNYKEINGRLDNKFEKDFYNLLFK